VTQLVGIDVGGTFTDLVMLDSETGALVARKVPTTVGDQAVGFLDALDRVGVDRHEIDSLVHGTTTGTNAILERTAPPTALITTRGFGDLLEMGRRTRPNLNGLGGEFEPLIAADRRVEVSGRMSAWGEELEPLDIEEIKSRAAELAAAGCVAVAISFIHGYRYPEHEIAAAQAVAEVWPNSYVCRGSEVLPQIREFERTTAAVLNAMLQPLVTSYTSSLSQTLAEQGYRRPLLIVQANGGVMDAARSAQSAIHTVLSGPAAGVSAAAAIGRLAGYPNIISADMGGTSFDVAMIRDGRPGSTQSKSLAFRVPLGVPTTDIETIGAGGGSIASVDRGGILRVGPESAGSEPGPVCYGRGGERPTVTDANVWLGRLDPTQIPDVDSSGALEAIERALRTHIADPLGVSVDESANAIVALSNEAMASAIRLISIGRGVDPRDFALMTFGGAGPLHAVSLARALAIPTVIVPLRPGVTSALGCVVADLRRDHLTSFDRPVEADVLDDLRAAIAELTARGVEEIGEQGVGHEQPITAITLDMLYSGQFHMISVPLGEVPSDIREVRDAFETSYSKIYGSLLDGGQMRISAVRVTTVAPRPSAERALTHARSDAAAGDSAAEPRTTRRVWFGDGFVDAAIYDRSDLAAGHRVSGPAVVEQSDSTTVLDPGSHALVDPDGNLLVNFD
jgi:N-methylhydantoinase A